METIRKTIKLSSAYAKAKGITEEGEYELEENWLGGLYSTSLAGFVYSPIFHGKIILVVVDDLQYTTHGNGD